MFIVEEDLFSYNKIMYLLTQWINWFWFWLGPLYFPRLFFSSMRVSWKNNQFMDLLATKFYKYTILKCKGIYKKRWHTDLEKCSLLLVCSLIISLAMGLLPKPSLSILLVEAGIEAGIVNVNVHWLIIWSFPENKCSSFNLTYCSKIVWVQWWPKIIKWSPGIKYWLPEKQDTVQI